MFAVSNVMADAFCSLTRNAASSAASSRSVNVVWVLSKVTLIHGTAPATAGLKLGARVGADDGAPV